MLTKQALGNTLWGMADILRDKVEDYKSYILTLLFFKRLSDNYTWEIDNGVREFQEQYDTEPNEKQKQKIAKDRHDFFIPEGCFWKDVRTAPADHKNEKLHNAVTQISDANPPLKGIINTVRWNEPAPDGSGGFLINAAKYMKNISYDARDLRLHGQESVWNTWAICNINMVLHGLDAQVKQGDTLKQPKFVDEENELTIKTFDLVMANFPFSADDWWKNGTNKKDRKGKEVKKKDGSPQKEYPGKEDFSDPYERFTYGIPPFSKGDFAFLQHIVASMNEKGRAGVVCPQGVLFRGQPEKTEEEDGQNRKADDEYIIRRGLLQGPVNKDGEFVQGVNIIDAIVVLPGNLFYGTTIPGAIVFFNKNKPEERKDKVLMVYAAKEGWYKEEANLNMLLPPDMLRISTILESWGDKAVAQGWITSQKARLRGLIQEELDFKLAEIEAETCEDIALAKKKLKKAIDKIETKEAEDKKPTKTELNTRDKAEEALSKLIEARDVRIAAAHEQAEQERKAIDAVEQELMSMLDDPELRKRYFSVVDMEEIEENEFNLNIPRYVDTFEPEEEIDLKGAIAEYRAVVEKENTLDDNLSKLLDAMG